MTVTELRDALMAERFVLAQPSHDAPRQDVRVDDPPVIADAKAQLAHLFDPDAAQHWDCLAKAINPRRAA